MLSFQQIITPIWNSPVIYDEFFTMVDENGIAAAPLLFEPDKILSVTSADKTEHYEEGRDWFIHKNLFRLTPESRIFSFKKEELCLDEEIAGHSFVTKDGHYSLFYEGHYFHDKQICITYKKKSGEFGFQPAFCGDMLPRTMRRLKSREPLSIVLYGDSISAGSNASGVTMTTPFLPTWGSLVAEGLRRFYNTDINFANVSRGGMDSDWGIANAKNLVGDKRPDLAIIAFGMNDRVNGKAFTQKIKHIMDIILESSPNTEFILCATTLPNKNLPEFCSYQHEYKEELDKLVKQGTVVANFRDMQAALMEKKRFIDLTGNNVNHPNDFMVRCHAQLILSMLTNN